MSGQADQGAAGTTAPVDENPLLFISHRHEHKAIADVLRTFIDKWTGGAIDVHQSSSAQAQGPRQGQNLSQELRRYLWRASVVVLLYASHDEDWSYCMWECGVAQLPEPSATRTIVLQSSDQHPAVFGDQLRVRMRSQEDIVKLVDSLLTESDAFPQLGRAVTRHARGSDTVKAAALELHAALAEVLPGPEDVREEDEWPPYPQLTIGVSDDQIRQIVEARGTDADRVALTYKILIEESSVIGGDAKVGTIFGMNGFPLKNPARSIPLADLVGRWEETTPTPSSRWRDDVARQILTVVTGGIPTARWQLLRGADPENTAWYGAVVRYFKRVRSESRAEIDVTFCRFRVGDDGTARIEICEVREQD